jgi:hypothetical protein
MRKFRARMAPKILVTIADPRPVPWPPDGMAGITEATE